MKVSTFGKGVVAVCAAALIAGAIATPAQADPTSGTFGTLVGVGSDTTQDVVNGIAAAIGGNKIASYNAVGTGLANTITTRSGGTSIPRVSGSGPGIDTLSVAIGRIAEKTGVALSDGTKTTIGSSVIGNVDFARSSSAPAAVDVTADGVLAYIPFARDAVDVAYAPSSPLASVPLYLGSSADAVDAPSLYRIYRGDVKYFYFNGATYFGAGASATVPSGATFAYQVQPLLPKSGSGTRKYFMGQLGLTDAEGYTTTNPFIKDKSGGLDIEEHDGTAIIAETSSSVLALGPFSIGQWVSQANSIPGVTDRRHNVVLAPLSKTASGQVAATTGAGPFATNASYTAMVRDVYNVVPSRLADDPSSNIAKAFVGSTSLVCSQPSVITTYGFLLEPATSAAATCGYSQLRANKASDSSVNLSVAGTALVGQTITATASVSSFGNGGGQVRFMSGSAVLATSTIAQGSTSVSGSFSATAVGSLPVTAVFVPALAGVSSSTSSAAAIAVAGTGSSVAFVAPTLTIGKSTPITVNIAGADSAGGTVTINSNGVAIGSATAAPGASSAVVTVVPKVITNSLTAVYTPNSTTVIGSVTAATVVKAAKGTAKITVSKIKTVKAGKTSKVTITVSGVVTPTGTVTIKEGKKTLTKSAKLSHGKVTVSIKKLKKGTHKISVTYNGNSIWKSVKKSGTTKLKIA